MGITRAYTTLRCITITDTLIVFNLIPDLTIAKAVTVFNFIPDLTPHRLQPHHLQSDPNIVLTLHQPSSPSSTQTVGFNPSYSIHRFSLSTPFFDSLFLYLRDLNRPLDARPPDRPSELVPPSVTHLSPQPLSL
ncbi:hypothetical protein L1887_16582 [Cichorium endivia]|nr:hypothetical protein L1887_16582 [Cichorium endivia]